MSTNTAFPIRVLVRAKGPVVDGIAVILRFQMERKNDYSYIIFLNSDGSAGVSGDELLRAFDEELEAAPMEYSNPRSGFTSITGHVMDIAQITKALEAYKLYSKWFQYPIAYEDNLRVALARGDISNSTELEIEVIYDVSSSGDSV